MFESLREMKALIEREVARRDLTEDIKLGDGGIREIEFIVQAFQLIRGGQDRRLQGTSLRRALPLLAGAKMLPARAVAELDAAYVFLRRLENRLQMRADQQVHRAAGRARRACHPRGCHGVRRLAGAGRATRRCTVRAWPLISARSCSVRTGHPRGPHRRRGRSPAPWVPGAEDPGALSTRLARAGVRGGPGRGAAAAGFPARRARTASRRDRRAPAAALLPVLVPDAASTPTPLAALRRLLRVLEAIGARSAYFALLLQNAPRVGRLVELRSHGDFLIEQIAAHPLLLDELIDERLFEELPGPRRARGRSRAAHGRCRCAGRGTAGRGLRQFQRAAMFRLAAADLLAATCR